MATENYAAALKRVLVHEGGWSDHPKDPGGATMKGVTQRVYDAYRSGRGSPQQSVRFITTEELQAIYKRQYWDAVKGDELPIGLDYVMFDGATNSGPGQSIKWLQRALGPLYRGAIDGVMGLGTNAALAAVNDVDALIARMCDRRLAFLKALKTWSTFGKGWAARVRQVGDAGQDWATGSVPSDANLVYVAGMSAKANVEDAKAPPTKAVADAATGGGIGVATISQAVDQLSPFADTVPAIGQIVAYLTLAGAAISLAGLGYRWWQKRREAERADALNIQSAMTLEPGV